MPGRHPKRGLRVGHSDGLVKPQRGKGSPNGHGYTPEPDGWYVYVWANSCGKCQWRAILGLRFAREQDAARGMAALTAAGLDTYAKLKVADAGTVRQIACENLQW